MSVPLSADGRGGGAAGPATGGAVGGAVVTGPVTGGWVVDVVLVVVVEPLPGVVGGGGAVVEVVDVEDVVLVGSSGIWARAPTVPTAVEAASTATRSAKERGRRTGIRKRFPVTR
jgi:hypothetical protein